MDFRPDGTGPHPVPPRAIAAGKQTKQPAPALVGHNGSCQMRQKRKAEGSGAGNFQTRRTSSRQRIHHLKKSKFPEIYIGCVNPVNSMLPQDRRDMGIGDEIPTGDDV